MDQTSSQETNKKTSKVREFTAKVKPLYIVALILLAVAIFSLFELVKARQELKNFKTNPEQAASTQIKKLVEEIGKIIDLPKDETPIVYNVTDPQKLKDEAFFANAQEGDKVLIYNNAKKAFLYRPSEKKVLNFASINIGTDTSKVTQDNTKLEKKFVILNGTAVSGLAGKYGDTLKSKIERASIASIGNANQKDVEKTFIVDSNGKNSQEIKTYANTLGIEVGILPTNQLDKDADFIIVVGADKAAK